MTTAPISPPALTAAFFLAEKRAKSSSPLAALETFLWLIKYHGTNELSWVFHLGVAESLFALKQVGRAAKEYQWVIDQAPNDAGKAEAFFRMGDLYQVRFQNEQALAAYSQAIRYLKNQAKNFPEFFLNYGE